MAENDEWEGNGGMGKGKINVQDGITVTGSICVFETRCRAPTNLMELESNISPSTRTLPFSFKSLMRSSCAITSASRIWCFFKRF